MRCCYDLQLRLHVRHLSPPLPHPPSSVRHPHQRPAPRITHLQEEQIPPCHQEEHLLGKLSDPQRREGSAVLGAPHALCCAPQHAEERAGRDDHVQRCH